MVSAELVEEVRALERALGRLEGRLELTEQAESTLREQLERERRRADEERKRVVEALMHFDQAVTATLAGLPYPKSYGLIDGERFPYLSEQIVPRAKRRYRKRTM